MVFQTRTIFLVSLWLVTWPNCDFKIMNTNFARKLQGKCWKDDVVTFTAHLSETIKRLTTYKQKVVLAAMLEGKSIPPTWRPIQILYFVEKSTQISGARFQLIVAYNALGALCVPSLVLPWHFENFASRVFLSKRMPRRNFVRKRNGRGFHGVENRDKVYCSSLRSRFVVSSIKSSLQKTSSLTHRLLAPIRFCKKDENLFRFALAFSYSFDRSEIDQAGSQQHCGPHRRKYTKVYGWNHNHWGWNLKRSYKRYEFPLSLEKALSLGIKLGKVSVISNNVDEIANEVRTFSSLFSFVITTGWQA